MQLFVSGDANKSLPEYLVLLSSILWIIGLYSSRISFSGFGLIGGLNPLVLMSVSLLIFTFFLGYHQRKGPWFFALSLILLILFLDLPSILLEQTPRIYANWRYYGYSEYIIRNGHLDPIRVWYHTWPGFPLLAAGFVSITGIEPTTIILITPIIGSLLITGLIVVLGKIFYPGDNRPWIAGLIINLFMWIDQNYFTAQNLALQIYVLAISLCFIAFSREKNIKNIYTYLSLFLLFTLFITHLLTFFMFAVAFITLLLARLYESRKALTHKHILVIIFGLVISCALLLLWLTTENATWVSNRIWSIMADSFRIGSVFNSYLAKLSTGSTTYRYIVLIRILYSALLVSLIFLIGIVNIRMRRRIKKKITREKLYWRPLLVLGIATFSLVFITSYSGEIIERLFLFLIPVLCIFALLAFNRRALVIVLVIFLVISPPFFFITKYGNEEMDHISPNEIKGCERFYEKYGNQTGWILFYRGNVMMNYKYIENYPSYAIVDTGLILSDGELNNQSGSIPQTVFFWYSSGDRRAASFYFSEEATIQQTYDVLINSHHWSVVISNPDFTVFRYNG